jgi:PLD-like domain
MRMDYQPIVTVTGGALKVTALVGAHTVILGFDLLGGAAQTAGLLGFAIERTNLQDGTREWLKNPLKFRSTPDADRFSIAGTPTNLAPIQQFHWGDYRLENAPGVSYRYAVSALYGDPRDPQPREAPTVIKIVPAPDHAPTLDSAMSLYFNRGVVATPAYRQQFDNARPGQVGTGDVPAAQHYLSRGLWEALLAFIDAAAADDALDVAIYELHHESVIAAFQRAIDRGVAVRLLYHARTGEDSPSVRTNRARLSMLHPAATGNGPPPHIRPRQHVRGLSHNKFIVHSHHGLPRQVWTGSTNFTDAGFFLQTNVGIVLRDPAIAHAYAAYFALLFQDPATSAFQQQIGALDLRLTLPSIPQLFFAPVAGDAFLQTAAELIRGAQDAVLISCPFGLEQDGVIAQAIHALDPHILVCGLLNTNQRGDLLTLDMASHDIQEFVVPGWIKQLNGQTYDASVGRGNQVHVKSLVVDPWGPHPQVLIGSANFSGESVNDNDENALLIDGDGWAAAIVATEFLRVFEHYRFRNHIQQIAERVDTQARPTAQPSGWAGGMLSAADAPDALDTPWFLDLDDPDAPSGGVLSAVAQADYWLTESDAWAGAYFTVGSPRCRERAVFVP